MYPITSFLSYTFHTHWIAVCAAFFVGIASGIFMAAKSGVAWWKATVILTAGYIFSIIGRIAGIISDPYSIYLAGNTGFFKILISHDIG